MQELILAIHILVSITIIVLVMIQHGKGADAGAAFGSGASGTMFGSQGVTPFLTKVTTVLAAVFFVTSLTLSYYSAHHQNDEDQLLNNLTKQSQPVKKG